MTVLVPPAVPPAVPSAAMPRSGDAVPDSRRPLAISAALAGLSAAGAVLLACLALALVAWFATDAGAHGTTKDALRLGSDAWLLAHGSSLDLGVATVTVAPLALTVLCAFVCYRLGAWAGATSAAEELATVGLAALVMASAYGLVAIVTAVLATARNAQPALPMAFGGGFALALVAGGSGLLTGSGRWSATARLPDWLRAASYGGAVAALGTATAGGALAATALLLDLGDGANVLARLQVDPAGGALYTLVVAGFAPNVALLGASYLVGPGFAVGAGTSVTVAHVTLGPVPAFPLLAALPGDGAAPGWVAGLLVVPVLVAGVAGHLTARAHPRAGYLHTLLQGVATGAGGGLLLAVGVCFAGGAVGPGRMTDVGAAVLPTWLAATAAFSLGAAAGATLTRWRSGPPADGTEPTVDLHAG